MHILLKNISKQLSFRNSKGLLVMEIEIKIIHPYRYREMEKKIIISPFQYECCFKKSFKMNSQFNFQ